MTRTIVSVRDGKNIPFVYAKKNPATAAYYDSTQITSVSAQVIKPDGSTLATTNPITFVYTTATGGFKGYVANWDSSTDLYTFPWVTVVITPVRAGIAAALAMPKEMELDLSDLAKRQDEIEVFTSAAETEASAAARAATNQAEHDATQVAVALLETEASAAVRASTNQGEHDQTQSQVAQIGAAAEAQLLGPSTAEIPDSGTNTFQLDFVLKDLDTFLTALIDPDDDLVTVTAINQAGAAPTGVTLANAGVMTRDSLGQFSLLVTIGTTAVDRTQLRFTAAYERDNIANVAKWNTTLGDFDQLDTIQSELAAHRAEVEPELDQIKQDTTTDLPAQIVAAEANVIGEIDDNEAKLDIIDAQVDAIRAVDVPAIQTNIDAEHVATRSHVTAEVDAAEAAIQANVDAEHVVTRALIQSETDDVDADVAALQADFDAFEVTNQGEHNATQVSILTRESEASASSRAATDQAEHDATQAAIAAIPATDLSPVISRLDNATYGLAALNTDLDAILARLGITNDTGGSTTAGTTMAKLNSLLATVTSRLAQPDVVFPSQATDPEP